MILAYSQFSKKINWGLITQFKKYKKITKKKKAKKSTKKKIAKKAQKRKNLKKKLGSNYLAFQCSNNNAKKNPD